MKDKDIKSVSLDSGIESLDEVEVANEFSQGGGKLSLFILGNSQSSIPVIQYYFRQNLSLVGKRKNYGFVFFQFYDE